MSRPDYNRDESYNRIRLDEDLKSRICSQILDSSDSLPLSSGSEDSAPDKPAPTTTRAPILDSTDEATPVPEKANPLEQPNTAQRKDAAAEPTPGVFETPNITPIQSKNMGPMINRLVTEDDSTLSLASTAADGEGAKSMKGRPKMPGRPSTMKRIGTAIKKSISHGKQ